MRLNLRRKRARAGVRLLGPNYLGTYSPRGKLTFPSGARRDRFYRRHIAVGRPFNGHHQARPVARPAVQRAGDDREQHRRHPARIGGLLSGRSADQGVGLYIEDVKDARAFFDLLRSEKATKPVVILKGGRSGQGRLAAASHTGALAGDDKAWDALAQPGACGAGRHRR